MSETEHKKLISKSGWSAHLVTAVVAAAATVFSQSILAGPQQTTADADYIRSLGPRISELEAEVATLRAENTKLKISEAVREAAGDGDFAFQDVLCSILEAQPGLNWAKLVETSADSHVTFRIACLDTEYRARFQIGVYEYLGQTDFDYWPPDIADEFYKNDLAVYASRRPLITVESWVEPDGATASGQLTKFYYRFSMPGGEGTLEFIVGHLPRTLAP